MPFCINCGVELSANVTSCPLCYYAMPNPSESSKVSPRYLLPVATEDPEKIRKSKTILTSEFLSIVFAIVDVLLVAIDLIINFQVTWSRYPLTAITAFWIYIILMLSVAKSPYQTFTISAIVIILMICGIDLLDGTLSWFLPLAFPICISTLLLVFLIMLAFNSNTRYSLIAVFIACSISIESFITNYFISHYFGETHFSWSLIVAACMAPIAIVGLIHYFFLSRYFDTGKYIHY